MLIPNVILVYLHCSLYCINCYGYIVVFNCNNSTRGNNNKVLDLLCTYKQYSVY